MNAWIKWLANVPIANVRTHGEVMNAAVVETSCTFMSTIRVLVSSYTHHMFKIHDCLHNIPTFQCIFSNLSILHGDYFFWSMQVKIPLQSIAGTSCG